MDLQIYVARLGFRRLGKSNLSMDVGFASVEASILGCVGIAKQVGECEEDVVKDESEKRNTI
jgi:hypothetical protein